MSRCPAGLVSAVESGAWIGEQATASGGNYAELCSATTAGWAALVCHVRLASTCPWNRAGATNPGLRTVASRTPRQKLECLFLQRPRAK